MDYPKLKLVRSKSAIEGWRGRLDTLFCVQLSASFLEGLALMSRVNFLSVRPSQVPMEVVAALARSR